MYPSSTPVLQLSLLAKPRCFWEKKYQIQLISVSPQGTSRDESGENMKKNEDEFGK